MSVDIIIEHESSLLDYSVLDHVPMFAVERGCLFREEPVLHPSAHF